MNNSATTRMPLLGICPGTQLMAKSSEEGTLPGLGWIDTQVKNYDIGTNESNLKMPHMGWSLININKQVNLFLDK